MRTRRFSLRAQIRMLWDAIWVSRERKEQLAQELRTLSQRVEQLEEIVRRLDSTKPF